MKHSMRFRITLTLVLTVASAILLCWILNKTFLEDYYQYSKLEILDSAFYEINTIFNEMSAEAFVSPSASADQEGNNDTDDSIETTESGLSSETIRAIDQVATENNIKICIYDISYGYGTFVSVFINGTYMEAKRVSNVLMYYLVDYRLLGPATELLKSEHEYKVFKMYEGETFNGFKNDKGEKGQDNCYIDLVGSLNEYTLIVLRTNVENLQESANIANKFLSYVGVIIVIISAIVMFIISRSFTKPILEMSAIAKRMTDLDFEVTYPVKSQDEIGELGNSINILSKKLEFTISELKSVNNELQKDIASKIQIDEMRKEFLSNVTHELKTPIALIQGYAEGLQENINDDQESREFYCEVIVDEAAKMNKMVKKLLSLNQIEFGTNKVEMERFNITALIQSVLNSFDIMIKQKAVTLRFEEKEPVYVWADEYMIEEVVTNYISNALNHVSGINIIEIKLILTNDNVRIAVFNTGELIPEEDIDKLWIKFYKVDKARTREYGGNGIGLSIVKAILDSHNKNYGVVNHISGVEFWFELDAHA